MRIFPAMLVCLLTSFPAISESLQFTVYRLAGEERELIAEGKRDYSVSDIDVIKWGRSRKQLPGWKKTLELTEGFKIGIVVYQGDDLSSGFGIWISSDHHPEGFSWEWFEPGNSGIFKKLQGEGYVRATLAKTADGVEIQSVEFLTDVTLRFKEDVRIKPPGTKTHEVVVTQGSVFRFAP